MKILGLVLALALVMAGSCAADTVTMNIYTGWNLIATPLALYDGTPSVVFANVFAQYPNPSGCLSTLVFGNGSSYDAMNPAAFGNILLGQGYWIRPKTSATTATITGFPDGLMTGGDPATQTDMWISLPGNSTGTAGAWHMIGYPFDHDLKIANKLSGVLNTDPADGSPVVQFTNGTDVKSWPEAVAANWVDGYAYGADTNLYGGGFTASYLGLAREDIFRARHGYTLRTKVANLAMIIHAHGTMAP